MASIDDLKLPELKQLVPGLKSVVLSMIGDAEKLIDSDPEKGFKILKRANKFYDGLGYDLQVNCRINDVIFAYADRHNL
jgi:hypothetical protein